MCVRHTAPLGVQICPRRMSTSNGKVMIVKWSIEETFITVAYRLVDGEDTCTTCLGENIIKMAPGDV